jgi:phage gpG-like protein
VSRSGLHFEVGLDGLDGVMRRLEKLQVRRSLVLDRIAQTAENQVKRRIAVEKTAPDGTPWKPNGTGTSILVRTGHLRDSIHHVVEASDRIRIGSGLIYAGIHQTGGVIRAKGRALVFNIGDRTIKVAAVTIPARPYLGFSDANKRQIERQLITLIAETLDGPPA